MSICDQMDDLRNEFFRRNKRKATMAEDDHIFITLLRHSLGLEPITSLNNGRGHKGMKYKARKP